MMTAFWIATTPRTGSNYFCDLLFERAEVQTPKEFLNLEFLGRLNLVDGESRVLFPSFSWLVDHIGEKWQNTVHPLCIKALYSQFDFIRTLPGARESLSEHPVIMLVRRDVVAQAVSQHIARSTGTWIAGAAPRRQTDQIPYDFNAIDAAADRIERHNSLWRRTFNVSGVTHEEIAYEQFSAHPDEVVEHVIKTWKLTPRTERRPVPRPHRTQTTDLNARFIEQYRQDKAKAIFSPTTVARPA